MSIFRKMLIVDPIYLHDCHQLEDDVLNYEHVQGDHMYDPLLSMLPSDDNHIVQNQHSEDRDRPEWPKLNFTWFTILFTTLRFWDCFWLLDIVNLEAISLLFCHFSFPWIVCFTHNCGGGKLERAWKYFWENFLLVFPLVMTV